MVVTCVGGFCCFPLGICFSSLVCSLLVAGDDSFALLNGDEDLEYGARYRWYLWMDTRCIFLVYVWWEGFLSWCGVYFVVKNDCHG
jgi:hypothetical protein